jgi:hypothetical protein
MLTVDQIWQFSASKWLILAPAAHRHYEFDTKHRQNFVQLNSPVKKNLDIYSCQTAQGLPTRPVEVA